MQKTHYQILAVLALMVSSFLAGWHFTRGRAGEHASARRVLYWFDPMHPAYKSDKPGIAPDCGMQLEPVYADSQPGEAISSPVPGSLPGAVHISLDQQQLIGLRTAAVETASGARNVRLSGRVVADEERTYRVASGTDGYIGKTSGDSTGSLVKKDQVLATLVGTELIVAEQGYLSNAIRSPDSFQEMAHENDWRYQTSKLALGRLRALGMGEAQIKLMTEKHQLADSIDVVSPIDGFIVARNISPGQRFEKGAEFYRVADLSRVWILADVFENEAGYFHPGTVAAVTLPQQGKKFRARVSDVLPQFDPATRTLKIRLEADNPGFVLRPDMFVDIELPTSVPPGLSVPVDALIDSGLKKRVFIDRGNGFFEPREVETGWRLGDRVQVISGLKPDDRVVVAGTFLMDSESRLKATATGTTAPPVVTPVKKEGEVGQYSGMAAIKEAQTPARLVKDPSCGMDIDPAVSVAAGNTSSYRGTTYYFCSRSCKSEFEKEPQRYLASIH